jgi:hypothetical protein
VARLPSDEDDDVDEVSKTPRFRIINAKCVDLRLDIILYYFEAVTLQPNIVQKG